MFGSSVLELAIGLVFIYFLLSVIVSHIAELIAAKLAFRADALEDAIFALFGSDSFANGVLNHPLIQNLVPGGRPSYVPARTFALAVIKQLGTDAAITSVEQLRAQVSALQESEPKQVLLALIDGAEPPIRGATLAVADVRAEIERWFNDAMDRLSGVYKRKLVTINLVLAACVVVVIGVDTIAIATVLWQEQGIRATLAASATQATSPVSAEDAINTLSQFNLPLGWGTVPNNWLEWLLKVVGLMISVLAVSLGTPFWFDVLNRLGSLRAAGPVPARGATEVVAIATPPGGGGGSAVAAASGPR